MKAVLQTVLPFTPWSDPVLSRLPGTGPADRRDAFLRDEAYDGQMALRDALIETREADVLATRPEAQAASEELLEIALTEAVAQGFETSADHVTRPDGVPVPIDRTRPMRTLGRLFQADYCILQKPDSPPEHILTAAILCFPASWTLSEKIGRPLMRIHKPVPPYDTDIGGRVQRLFDRLPEGQALWRANAHFYETPDLFAPKAEDDPPRESTSTAPYLRSERQVLFRLPQSNAIVFSIHTFMIARKDLSISQQASLADAAS